MGVWVGGLGTGVATRLPMAVVCPDVPPQGVDRLHERLAEAAARLDALVLEHGAVLLRSWNVETPADLRALCAVMGCDLASYAGGGSPRTLVSGRVYTSTEYAAKVTIALHIEASYLATMPRRIFFMCQTPPTAGGETPIGDMRRVLARLPARLVDTFVSRGLLHVSNLHGGSGFGKSWQATYETEDRAEVARIVAAQGCQMEWQADGGLRVLSRVPAVRAHPATGEAYWANQAVNWHPADLGLGAQRALQRLYRDPMQFPKSVFFTDGSPIADDDIRTIRQVLDAEETTFAWQRGDVLILDNQRMAHGRRSFAGQRRILVAMA